HIGRLVRKRGNGKPRTKADLQHPLVRHDIQLLNEPGGRLALMPRQNIPADPAKQPFRLAEGPHHDSLDKVWLILLMYLSGHLTRSPSFIVVLLHCLPLFTPVTGYIAGECNDPLVRDSTSASRRLFILPA